MGKHFLKYPGKNVSTARMLRKKSTDAEKRLWSLLRNNQMGVHFRRQVPYGNYILDFFSIEAKLVVELDGSQHYSPEGIAKDKQRDGYLIRNGFKILRYQSGEVFSNIDGVIEDIYNHVQEALQPK
ncbi:MAG: DUF559 domain-containing protein [Ignavibacteriae bacterium]|nr:DUF559 domain-containing protein [Ignavibacteriota bacterium]